MMKKGNQSRTTDKVLSKFGRLDNKREFYGKDKTKWATDSPLRGKIAAKNIKTLPGLKGAAKQNKPNSALQSWRLLIMDNVIEQIVVCTNAKIWSISNDIANSKKENIADLNFVKKCKIKIKM
nr:unnamed protein product [Callosobruchus analis]